MLIGAPKRTQDVFGSGSYGASRGTRKHNGIDYACYPDSAVFAPATGIITKIGYPYADDLSFRYVQITTEDGLDYRIFYISPIVGLNDFVTRDHTIIGISQKLGDRYPDITEHVHFEVKVDGVFVNPEELG